MGEIQGRDSRERFKGKANCGAILNGTANIEELRIPARDFNGMGLRILNKEKQVWSDFWMNAKTGRLLTPGVEGSFHQGRGEFIETNQDTMVRGVWDNITTSTCSWQQASSADGGETWQTNWVMD